MTPIDVLDYLTEQSINHAGRTANQGWYREATAAVALLCKRGKTFTTDDVWQLMAHTGLETHDRRALGAVMREAARDRLVVHTGRYRQSVRRACHRRPLAVWEPVRIVRIPR